MKKNLANYITITRIIGTLILIFLPVFSKSFYIIYIWCGISDVLDGFIARKTKTTSSLGSKLDTVSDLFFYTIMMLKIWDILQRSLPIIIWILIYVILGLRAIYYIYLGIKYSTLASKHSILNKITGVLMFLLPFIVNSKYLFYCSILILLIAYTSLGIEVFNLINNSN